MKNLFCILFYIILFVAPAYCLLDDAGIDALDQTGSARTYGMGQAYTASSHDVNSIFHNPAGLSDSRGFVASFKDLKNFSLGLGYNTGIGTLGIGMVYRRFEDIASLGEKTNYENTLLLIAWGNRVGRFSLGVTVKTLLNQRLSMKDVFDRTSSSGNDIDAGIIWHINDYAQLGMVSHNALSGPYKIGSSEEVFPQSTRAGLSLLLLGVNGLWQSDPFAVMLNVDSETGKVGDNNKVNSYAGLEISYVDTFFVRFGGESLYSIDTTESSAAVSSVGLGYKFGDSTIDLASFNDPITKSSVTYISLTYSPPKFDLFAQTKPTIEATAAKIKLKDILNISFPPDDLVSYDEYIPISGETRPKATVEINDAMAYVDEAGKFSALQSLNPGKNLIIINASDANGSRSETKKVLRKAKIVIAEEQDLNKRAADEIKNKEAEIKQKELQIQKDKEKGIDVTDKENALVNDKAGLENTKQEISKQKQKNEERKEKVENLVTLGVIEVSPEKSFAVEAPIKRGEMLSWLVKAAGLPTTKPAKTPFIDVPETSEYAPQIKAAFELGLIKMSADKKFRPNDPVSEEEGQAFFKAFGIIQ
jgi:hypothetical protein